MFGDWKEWRLKEKWQLYKPEETGVGRKMSGRDLIGDRAPPPKEFRVYRQPRSVNVWQMHRRRKETDTDKPKPTTFLRQPQSALPAVDGDWLRGIQVTRGLKPFREYGADPRIPEKGGVRMGTSESKRREKE